MSTKLKEYLDVFLYSLVLASGLDVAVLDLTEGPAEVAFKLRDLYFKELTSASTPPKTSAKTALPSHAPAQEEDGEVGTPGFAWETPTLPLSDDLQLLVHKAAGGEKLRRSGRRTTTTGAMPRINMNASGRRCSRRPCIWSGTWH